MNTSATDHVVNRIEVISALTQEMVGPSPQGNEIDCNKDIKFDDPKMGFQPWRQLGSGEEILTRDAPSIRYGVGVLFPSGTHLESETLDPTLAAISDTADTKELMASESNLNPDNYEIKEPIERNEEGFEGGAIEEPETDNLDLSAANNYKPSTMAVSLLAEFPAGSILKVEASGGRYYRKTVKIAGHERTWWLRSPVYVTAEFAYADLCSAVERKIKPARLTCNGTDGFSIDVEVFVRPYQGVTSLITICLINRSKDNLLGNDEMCLFQAHFKAMVEASDQEAHILPYPQPDFDDMDPEKQSLTLLYRKSQTFAVGHGCAANWETYSTNPDKVRWVTAECLPVYETPSITPEIKRKDGSLIEIPMAELAGLIPGKDGFDALSELADRYEEWIVEKRSDLPSLNNRYRHTAEEHLNRCSECADRIRDGIHYLKQNSRSHQAFQFANHAILLQQICGQHSLREIRYDAQSSLLGFSPDYEEPHPETPPKGKGQWRAFQIAFILMALESVAEEKSPHHETVDLIWFPTGGGKTEAYLGLSAFAMFLRRIKNPRDAGTDVLMRYTLRLLTSQQFQRASGLICAMEYIRRNLPNLLGQEEFSIGIWLGGEVTPNTRKAAIETLRGLAKGTKHADNGFVLGQCPWCGAQMGPVKYKGRVSKNVPQVVGYEREGNTVVFRCPDRHHCAFGSHLPIYVIDEDIYERRPTLIIGTVDKFAILPWRPDARTIFGINPDGERIYSPPSLIIQDELHLISGPLGSMVGLYEGVIEELCTSRLENDDVRPKIVSSTATIRRYAEQIRALYAREKVMLFPPPGVDVEDSFFTRYARNDDGSLAHGKIYAGVHAPSLGSVQTAQVRTFTALLQAPMCFSSEGRDPWWTLVAFFNSLRELGNTLSLLQSDIPTRLRILRNRLGAQFSGMRQIRRTLELTGRMKNEEVKDAIPTLQITCTDRSQPIDVCLASNIIEVGIDIDRLSLMVVVGQPKTTSQYIQVTGRIGRLWKERPGLIVTIYSPSKPRDRSHFEKFRSYHEKLYAQVEPTSVTPFSFPALERALHATMAAYARQSGDQTVAASPYPFPDGLIAHLYEILLSRLERVDSDEIDNFKKIFNRRVTEWRQWQRTQWSAQYDDNNAPLLTRAGAYVNPEWEGITWRTPTSMRNVDAECEMEITTLYLREMEGDHE